MNRIAWLAQRISTAKDLQKRWKKREEEWKKELDGLLDEEVAYVEPGKTAQDSSVIIDAGEFKVSRTVYNLTSTVDIDRLREYAPAVYRRVITMKTERYLDMDKLEEIITESPEVFELVHKAMVPGQQRRRFDFKKREE